MGIFVTFNFAEATACDRHSFRWMDSLGRRTTGAWSGRLSRSDVAPAFSERFRWVGGRRQLSQRARMSWYALAPAPDCDDRPLPELALPEAIILDDDPPPSSREQ